AVKRTTQRVNLFDKVLIPNAQETIRRIQIFLADADRAAVVRAKLAKQKHHHRASVLELGGQP
ncbi:MAG: V-type ATP synthase subunit D, partial [Deinococcota bacterium]